MGFIKIADAVLEEEKNHTFSSILCVCILSLALNGVIGYMCKLQICINISTLEFCEKYKSKVSVCKNVDTFAQ